MLAGTRRSGTSAVGVQKLISLFGGGQIYDGLWRCSEANLEMGFMGNDQDAADTTSMACRRDDINGRGTRRGAL